MRFHACVLLAVSAVGCRGLSSRSVTPQEADASDSVAYDAAPSSPGWLAGGGAGGGGGGAGGARVGAGGAGAGGQDVARDASAAGALDATATVAAAGDSVATQKYGNARLSWQSHETRLTPANVNPDKFGKLFSRAVKGQVYAQPLYVAGLTIAGKGKHNVLFVATEANNVYAFDADDPAAAEPLWMRNLGPSVTGYMCKNLAPEMGITGTPAIDLARGTAYVVSRQKAATGEITSKLYALDITTGQDRPGGPVTIDATVPGTGDGSMGGMVRFDPVTHMNRPALALVKGQVLIGFASLCDYRPYHGWLFAYDAATLKQTGVYNTTPDGSGGGIWGGGSGIVSDDAGFAYVATGNGGVVVNGARMQLSNAVLKLEVGAAGLKLADWFVAGEWQKLNGFDADLGSSGPMLLPKSNVLLAAGKSGFAYVVDGKNLGHLQADDAQIVQKFSATGANPDTGGGHTGGFAYWEGPAGPMVYVWPGLPGRLLGYRVDPAGKFAQPAALMGPLAPGYPGGSLTVSSNGADAGILWAYTAEAGSAVENILGGVVRAFDATSLKELWNSNQRRDRDRPGSFGKFVPPLVVAGRVYVATFSDQVAVYGALP